MQQLGCEPRKEDTCCYLWPVITAAPYDGVKLVYFETGQDQAQQLPLLLQENVLGQKFVVDATLWTDLTSAGQSDHLHDTIDYSVVYS